MGGRWEKSDTRKALILNNWRGWIPTERKKEGAAKEVRGEKCKEGNPYAYVQGSIAKGSR